MSEQLFDKEQVGGSNPSARTKFVVSESDGMVYIGDFFKDLRRAGSS